MLGHSLHDAHLVEELSESGKPIAAVAYAPRINGHYDALASKDATALSAALPDVKLIGGDFGQGAKWSDLDAAELKLWLRDPTRK
ncbi:hypothetical protein [Leifsonia sp. P73]|uniref:hypothetical protein n=1 Tax=Leifsonia sp. P73 TaxID=3423959 RepID=UPI003DA5EB80